MATSILDIPQEVISTCLLPLLSVNEVLRTRRVCKWIKRLSDDYLSRHPRSRNIIEINFPESESDSDEPRDKTGWGSGGKRRVSLKSFLQEEHKLETSAARTELGPPLRIPVSRLRIGLCPLGPVVDTLDTEDFQIEMAAQHLQNALLSKFLERYGSHVKNLHICREFITYFSDDEVNFYHQLPNLKHFSFQQDMHGSLPGQTRAVPPQVLLQGFSKLTTLKMQDIPSFPVWQLVELCTNIKTLAYRTTHIKLESFRPLLNILDRNQHKKLEFLHIEDVHRRRSSLLSGMEYGQLMSELYAVVVKLNLKLGNVSPHFIDEMEENLRNLFAPRIVSLGSFKITHPSFDPVNFLNVKCFPNLEAINLYMDFTQPLPNNQNQVHSVISRNLGFLSVEKMPTLRKLEIWIQDHYTSGESSRALARIWSNFSNLEELYFDEYAPVLEDVAFIGEAEQLPFLQLSKLKILHLGIVDRLKSFESWQPNPRNVGPVTDATFTRIFSQMKLHEFRIKSLQPLQNVTVAGIRALRAGPFGETIELFPFHSWSLEGVSREEFQLLSKEFTCNTF